MLYCHSRNVRENLRRRHRQFFLHSHSLALGIQPSYWLHFSFCTSIFIRKSPSTSQTHAMLSFTTLSCLLHSFFLVCWMMWDISSLRFVPFIPPPNICINSQISIFISDHFSTTHMRRLNRASQSPCYAEEFLRNSNLVNELIVCRQCDTLALSCRGLLSSTLTCRLHLFLSVQVALHAWFSHIMLMCNHVCINKIQVNSLNSLTCWNIYAN